MKRYEKYKDSGVDWIGEIPQEWKMRKLKFLGNIYAGINGKKGDDFSKEYSEGIKSFIPFTNICNNIRIDETKYQFVKVDEKENQNRVQNNDILFLMSSETLDDIAKNSIYLGNDDELYLNSFCKGFRMSDSNVFPEYINYLFLSASYRNYFSLVGRGFTRINLKQEFINDVYTLLPTFSEQKSIATFLDDKTAKIDQTIANKQKEIELLKERRQILIQKAVTKGLDDTVKLKDSGVDWIGEIPEHWEVRKLKQVCKINVNSLDERTNPNYEFEYIDIGSVTYENGIINREYFLFKNAPSRARRIAKEGDTIVSTVRTYLKAIDFIDKSKSNYIFSTGFAVLEPNNDVYPKYLFSFIKSDAFTEQVSVNSKGMSYPAINSTELGAQKVLHLPYEEQTQIVSYLEVIEEKIAKAILLKQQETEKLKEYKTVLIDNVVTGKVKIN